MELHHGLPQVSLYGVFSAVISFVFNEAVWRKHGAQPTPQPWYLEPGKFRPAIIERRFRGDGQTKIPGPDA